MLINLFSVLKLGYVRFHYVLNLSLGLQNDDGHVRNTPYIRSNIF